MGSWIVRETDREFFCSCDVEIEVERVVGSVGGEIADTIVNDGL